jgi:hypothetical protein
MVDELLKAALTLAIAEENARIVAETLAKKTLKPKTIVKPKGYTHPIKVAVDKLTVIDFTIKPPYTPLFSITLFNDGPDDVYPSVNTYQKLVQLKYGESLQIKFSSPKIEKLYLDVDDGKEANIRGFGIY